MRINAKIDAIAKEKGVTASLIKKLVYAESRYNTHAKGDGKYICPKTGKVAPSYGLVQISSCYFPEVSYEQATDEDFAIAFLAQKLHEGKCKLWSTCRLKDG